MDFDGKVALVTGAASGMGSEIAYSFAKEGADVAIFDLNKENGEKVAEKVRSFGVKSTAVDVDVSDFDNVNDAVQKVYVDLKKIDILINAAGYGKYVLFSEMSEETWDRSIAVHLKGTFNCTRAVINGMIDQGSGKIVNISSTTGINGSPMHSHYAAAKAGVIGLSKALAKEVASKGINVNVIAPGITDTPFLNAAKAQSPDILNSIIDSIPSRRLGTVQEIAALALFLCSGGASYIVGQVISPNGGFLT